MRPSETPEYWQSEFQVRQDDLNYLYEILVEEGVPRSVYDLARALIEHRQQQEELTLAEQSRAQGSIYRPKNAYSVGQRLLFPKLGEASGVVTGVRTGENPEYGSFEVIQVQFSGDGVREFAARFEHPHPLNEDEAQSPAVDVYALYGGPVAGKLQAALEANSEFVSLDNQWFLTDMLRYVHIGHLNIAEAVIDLAEMPLPTEELLKQVDLPAEVTPAGQAFILSHAMAGDPRFVDVGGESGPVWALARQQSAEAQ